MRTVLVATTFALAAACTPAESRAWWTWWRDEPAAAEQFARDGCNGKCLRHDIRSWETDEPDIYWPWNELAECESGGDWHINTGNGYYGGLQFALSSWRAVGGTGYPHEHSPAEQIHRGELLQDLQGWNAWPTCSRMIGLL